MCKCYWRLRECRARSDSMAVVAVMAWSVLAGLMVAKTSYRGSILHNPLRYRYNIQT